jgi:hypothetical protein
MKKALPVVLALLLAGWGGKRESSEAAMEGSGMKTDSAHSSMPMAGSATKPDSSPMGGMGGMGGMADSSGTAHHTAGMAHDTSDMGRR